MSLTEEVTEKIEFPKDYLDRKEKEEKIRMRKEALVHAISRNKNIDEPEYDIPSVLKEAEQYYEWLIKKP